MNEAPQLTSTYAEYEFQTLIGKLWTVWNLAPERQGTTVFQTLIGKLWTLCIQA